MNQHPETLDHAKPAAPAPTATPPRPRAVGIAATLMVVLTIVVLAAVALVMYEFVSIPDSVATGPDDLKMLHRVQATLLTIAGVCFITGLLVMALSVAIRRGRNWARIITFVTYGLFIVGMTITGLLFAALASGLATMNGKVEISTAEVVFDAVILSVIGAQIIGMIAVIWLLALPGTNRWFKSRR